MPTTVNLLAHLDIIFQIYHSLILLTLTDLSINTISGYVGLAILGE